MAAYPNYAILIGSRMVPENTHVDDVDDTGVQHSRQFRSVVYWEFRLRHQLSHTQYNSLMSTYNSGPRDTYTLTYFNVSPAETYSVVFTEPPAIIENLGSDRYEVEVNLRGSKD